MNDVNTSTVSPKHYSLSELSKRFRFENNTTLKVLTDAGVHPTIEFGSGKRRFRLYDDRAVAPLALLRGEIDARQAALAVERAAASCTSRSATPAPNPNTIDTLREDVAVVHDAVADLNSKLNAVAAKLADIAAAVERLTAMVRAPKLDDVLAYDD